MTETVVVLASDLMDRSRIAAAIPSARFVRGAAECAGAGAVVVDLGRHAGDVAAVRAAAPDATIVGFGSHVDDATLRQALADGADTVLPRSRFFRDPAAAVAGRAPEGAGPEPDGSPPRAQ